MIMSKFPIFHYFVSPHPPLLPSFLNIEFPVLALTELHGNLTFINGFADCLIIVMFSIDCNNDIIIIIRVLSGLLMIIIEWWSPQVGDWVKFGCGADGAPAGSGSPAITSHTLYIIVIIIFNITIIITVSHLSEEKKWKPILGQQCHPPALTN